VAAKLVGETVENAELESFLLKQGVPRDVANKASVTIQQPLDENALGCLKQVFGFSTITIDTTSTLLQVDSYRTYLLQLRSATFRGHRARKLQHEEQDLEQVQKLLKNMGLDEQSANEAAGKIQTTYRGHRVRKMHQEELELAHVEELMKSLGLDPHSANDAASKIQAPSGTLFQATFREYRTRMIQQEEMDSQCE
ncbi:unnamed protein product, partial [Timema podura]|nr:unnamed protein product [Timema podura]